MGDRKIKEGAIFGVGNPLLDICATVNDEFLQKYDLPPNAAILAGPKHDLLYEELINSFEIDYVPGGATQNALRYCQWMLGRNNTHITTFVGAIGDDHFGKMMEKKAKADGVNVKYQVDPSTPTGTCAVLLTNEGLNRSLCAFMGASEKLDKDHLVKNWTFAEKATIFVTSGHMLAVSQASVMEMARHAAEWGKDFFFNLAAPYVSEKYRKELDEVVPHVDYLFCNDVEAVSYAKSKGWDTADLKEICKKLAKEPKKTVKGREVRTAIVTQGHNPVLVCVSTDANTVKEYPVPQIDEKKIKDTNGAGDAFIGGFLAMFVQGKPLETCINAAVYVASECIQRFGATFPRENKFKP